MLQFGQSSTAEHWRQITDVAKPAPVEQNQRLFLALEPLGDRARQRPAQHHIVSGVRDLVAHVDHGDAGERTIEHALLHRHEGVLAIERVGVRLDGRRRRAEHDQRIRELAAHDRHVAAVIARHFILLVGGVVFLVDDDQPRVLQRREHRRPRADHHVDVAAPDAMPLIVALAVRQPAVLDGHGGAKPRAEQRRHLRRQRDLRHEHQHTAAALADHIGEAEVDLGLAAAGHAVHQRHVKRPRRRRAESRC